MQVFLETQRLVLRRFTLADVDNLVSLDADPGVMHFVTGGIPTARDEIENELLPGFLDYYEQFEGYGFWAAIEKSTGQFVGWFHFRPAKDAPPGEVELGYRLRKAAWGKGYATEAAERIVLFAKELGIPEVVAVANPGNIASIAVMKRLGMRYRGIETHYNAPCAVYQVCLSVE